MPRPNPRCSLRRRPLVAFLAVVLCGLAGLPVPPAASIGAVPAAWAQGRIDVDILTPGFAELPLSVAPGETFTISATTAPNAVCAGAVELRHHPTIELEAVAAPTGTCSWTVSVPATVRPSTGIVRVGISRAGQGWDLVGTFWISVVGESR